MYFREFWSKYRQNRQINSLALSALAISFYHFLVGNVRNATPIIPPTSTTPLRLLLQTLLVNGLYRGGAASRVSISTSSISTSVQSKWSLPTRNGVHLHTTNFYRHTFMHIHTHTCTLTHTHTCTLPYTHIYAHIHMHTHVYTHASAHATNKTARKRYLLSVSGLFSKISRSHPPRILLLLPTS